MLEVESAATSSYTQSYVYDGLNRLTETVFSPTNATATQALYVYNENGKLARVTAKYGASTVNTRYYGYDIENRLVSLAVTNGGGQRMLSLEYRYNSAQQITQVIERALVSGATRVSTNAYTYDARDQILTE